MFFTSKYFLIPLAFYAAIIPQTMSNQNCVSPCGNAKNTLNYSFCYTNEAFTVWEYCLPSAKGFNDNKLSLVQNQYINIDRTEQHEGDTYKNLTVRPEIFFLLFSPGDFSQSRSS